MTYTRKNRGVCSRSTTVELNDGIIEDIRIDDGCEGNLVGIQKLLKGRRAEEVIELLKGLPCEGKATSCPDQIALCLQEALENSR